MHAAAVWSAVQRRGYAVGLSVLVVAFTIQRTDAP